MFLSCCSVIKPHRVASSSARASPALAPLGPKQQQHCPRSGRTHCRLLLSECGLACRTSHSAAQPPPSPTLTLTPTLPAPPSPYRPCRADSYIADTPRPVSWYDEFIVWLSRPASPYLGQLTPLGRPPNATAFNAWLNTYLTTDGRYLKTKVRVVPRRRGSGLWRGACFPLLQHAFWEAPRFPDSLMMTHRLPCAEDARTHASTSTSARRSSSTRRRAASSAAASTRFPTTSSTANGLSGWSTARATSPRRPRPALTPLPLAL